MASSSDTQPVESDHQPTADEVLQELGKTEESQAVTKKVIEIETNNEDIPPTKDNEKQDKKAKRKGDNSSDLEIPVTEVLVFAEVKKATNPPSTDVPGAVNTKDADNSVSGPEASIILDSTSKVVEVDLEKPACEATENLSEILPIETSREMAERETEAEAVKEVAEEKLPVKLVENLPEEKPAIDTIVPEEKPVFEPVENLPDEQLAIEAKFENLEVAKPLGEAVDSLSDDKPTVEAVEILPDLKPSIELVENVQEEKPEVENVQKEKSAIEAVENVQEGKSAVEKVQDEKPAVEDGQVEKLAIEAVENALVDKPAIEKVQEEKPAVETVQEDKPTIEAVEILLEKKPAIEAVENGQEEKPAVENVQEEKLAVEDVKEEKPAVEDVKEDKSTVEDVKEEKPAVENAQQKKPPIEAVENVQEKQTIENVHEEKSAVEEAKEEKLEAVEKAEEKLAVENVQEEKAAIETVENVQEEKASDQNIQEDKPAVEASIIYGGGKVDEYQNSDTSAIEVARESLKDETILTKKVAELKEEENAKPEKVTQEKNEKNEEPIVSERIKNGDVHGSTIATAAAAVKSLEAEQGSRDFEVVKEIPSSVETENDKDVAEKGNESSAASNATEAIGDVKAEETNIAGTNLESTKEIVDDTKSDPPTKETTKEGDGAKTSKDVPTKEVSAKPAQKSSGNILSKVKQSIGKVKKAIIRKSPSSKTIPPEAKGDEKVN